MSLVLMKPELDVWKPGAHSGTFRGNNLAFVTATQALETYGPTPPSAPRSSARKAWCATGWKTWCTAFPMPACRAARPDPGAGVQRSPALANRIAKRAFGKGVVIETSGAHDEVLKLLPALTIEEGLLMRGLEVIEASVSEALADEDGSPPAF